MNIVVNDIPKTLGKIKCIASGVSHNCKKVKLSDGTVIWEVGGTVTTEIDVKIDQKWVKPSGMSKEQVNTELTTFVNTGRVFTVNISNYLPSGAIIDSLNDYSFLTGTVGAGRTSGTSSVSLYDVFSSSPTLRSVDLDLSTKKATIKISPTNHEDGYIIIKAPSTTFKSSAYDGQSHPFYIRMSITYHT